MKRRTNPVLSSSERPTKSRRKSSNHQDHVANKTKNISIQETESARQQARPYLLATARIPIRVLTAQWKIGQNRSLDFEHVQNLCSAFKNKALKRTSYDNYLLVSGHRESVRKMKEYLQDTDRISEEPLLFDKWAEINHGELLEMITGQHRQAALKEHGLQEGLDEKALWWTCEIYDSGTLRSTFLRGQSCQFGSVLTISVLSALYRCYSIWASSQNAGEQGRTLITR